MESDIRLEHCWAKTDPTTGQPALTVRDHCVIVGAVAEAVLRFAPVASICGSIFLFANTGRDRRSR